MMPALGLGVFQSAPEQTTAAVDAALATGYGHIDTAAAYGNEREVGKSIRGSGLDRSEVFIETKVWVSDYGYDQTLHAWDKATDKLGVDYLDLLILHQPAPDRFEKTIAAYKALEALLADWRVRAIGVSNFMPHHLKRLLAETDIVPAVNQVELHPYFTQPEVQSADSEHGILTQAWSPIGGITFYTLCTRPFALRQQHRRNKETPQHCPTPRSRDPRTLGRGKRLRATFNDFAGFKDISLGSRGAEHCRTPKPAAEAYCSRGSKRACGLETVSAVIA